jgi:predicted dinucleotide-binding enzyme
MRQMNLPGDPPVIAIIGAGEMGVAVGRRLREAGARVLSAEVSLRRRVRDREAQKSVHEVSKVSFREVISGDHRNRKTPDSSA